MMDQNASNFLMDLKSKAGYKLSHPIVESERQRHEKWGHTCVDVTCNSGRYFAYLCSCGIALSEARFGEAH